MADSSAHAEWPQLPDVAADWESRDVRSRVVIKADLLPAVSVLSLVALLGVPLGWAWSRLAPATRMRVLPGGDRAPLPMESWHEFTALAVFMLLGLAAGIVVAVTVWFLRARRGPVMLCATVAGSVLCAVFAMRLGTAFGNSFFAIEEAPRTGDVVDVAPELTTWWIVLAQPLAAALTYGILAVWNNRDDLGRRLG